MKIKNLALAVTLCSVASSSFALSKLDDAQMSEVEAQALMSLSYLAPDATTNPMKNITGGNNIGFYKLGLEAELELNANIKSLQLGCGGRNGEGGCDIDIKNLSISGLPDNFNTSTNTISGDGNPIYNNGRASTSAKLVNPYVQLAVRNPLSAATREVVGMRFSAESISGLLSVGTQNQSTASLTDGILSLSGFMRVAGTTGTANTAATKFGLPMLQYIGAGVNDQRLSGYAELCVGLTSGDCILADTYIRFESLPADGGSTGISVPVVSTNFNINAFTVNGVRQSDAVIKNIATKLAGVPIAAPKTGATAAQQQYFANDQLAVALSCNLPSGVKSSGCGLITGLKDTAFFKMAPGSQINNINLKIDFAQSLSMFHNIPLVNTGGYISLQQIPLLWPGAVVASADAGKTSLGNMTADTDVAKPGWWMSFAEPIKLGHLNVTQPIVLDNNAMKQLAERSTAQLLTINSLTPKARASGLGEIVGLLGGTPLASEVVVDLNAVTTTTPVYIQLANQVLGNQNVVPNCWGTLKFC